MIPSRLGSVLIWGIVVAGAQRAEGQQRRLLVLPFEITEPRDSAVTHELAAILREQLAAALLGEISVVRDSQRAEAFQAARINLDAIVPPGAARQLAHFLRADLYVIGSISSSGAMIMVELHVLTEDTSLVTATVACPFRTDTLRCGSMVVDSVLTGIR